MTKENKTIMFYINEIGCHICISHRRDADGYPQYKISQKKINLSRHIYQDFYGIAPLSKIVRHTCDNPNCINPNHLILGTHSDNMKDMAQRGRGRKNKQSYLNSHISRKLN